MEEHRGNSTDQKLENKLVLAVRNTANNSTKTEQKTGFNTKLKTN